MSTSKGLTTPAQNFERAIRGMYVRADQRLAKRLDAKGKYKEAAATEKRGRHRRELIEETNA